MPNRSCDRTLVSVLVFWVLASLMTSCSDLLGASDDSSSDSGGSSAGAVQFRVYDAATGEAIAGLTMGWDGDTAATDAEGFASFGTTAQALSGSATGDLVGTLEVRGNGAYQSYLLEGTPLSSEAEEIEIALEPLTDPEETIDLTVAVTFPDETDTYREIFVWVFGDNGGCTTDVYFFDSTPDSVETYGPEPICPYNSATVAIVVGRDSDSDYFADSYWSLYQEGVDLSADTTIGFDLADAD